VRLWLLDGSDFMSATGRGTLPPARTSFRPRYPTTHHDLILALNFASVDGYTSAVNANSKWGLTDLAYGSAEAVLLVMKLAVVSAPSRTTK
jgi:hypothetical protein